MMSQDEVLRVLECPLCFNYMSAPIYQCPTGHNVCNKCSDMVMLCPICRCGYADKRTRNFGLEDISRLMYYPCPNKEFGCNECIKIQEIDEHVADCRFRPYNCLLTQGDLLVELCEFIGSRDALMQHIRDNHKQSSWMRMESENRWEEDDPIYEVEAAFCYNDMFYLHRALGESDARNGTMYWALQCLGDVEYAKNYTYELQLQHEDGRVFNFLNTCQPRDLMMTEMIDSGVCIGVPVPILKTFTTDNKLHYTVRINAN